MCYGQDLIRVVHQLRESNELGCDVRGTLIGDGTGIDHLMKMSAELGLSNHFEFLGRRDASELPSLSLAGTSVCRLRRTIALGRCGRPGKLPIYLACGRLVIASRVGEAARILPNDMLVDYEGEDDPSYPRKVAERVKELVKRGTDFVDRPESRNLAAVFFDYDKLAVEYRTVIESSLRNSSRKHR